MVVDVGGGTTEVAVISLGGVVTSLSIRTAGDELDAAIVSWMKKEHGLMLGERTAEEVKMTLGSAFPTARGHRRRDPRPRPGLRPAPHRRGLQLRHPSGDGGAAAPTSSTRSAAPSTRRPPELAGDIMDRGIVLTGGGALLRGLDDRLRHETGMPVHVADDPLTSVAMGAAKCVEEFDGLQQVFVPDRRRRR